MAISIKQRCEERLKNLELNKERFHQSPYSIKQLKLRPHVIYPRENKDHLFVMSEGNRQVKEFTTSHYQLYGENSPKKIKYKNNYETEDSSLWA